MKTSFIHLKYYLKSWESARDSSFTAKKKRTVISGTYRLEIYFAIFFKLYSVLLRVESARDRKTQKCYRGVTKALLLSRSEDPSASL